MNSELVPKQIVDKNGKATTVRVRADKGSARVAKAPAVQAPADPTKQLHAALDAGLAILNDPNWQTFPVEVKAGAILAVNNPDADESVYAKADELAHACEDWNFHDTALKLWAGIGRARHAQNPDEPLTEAYSMGYDNLTPPALLQRIYDEQGAFAHSLSQNENSPAGVLEALASNDADWMRENVAKNKSTPAKVLEALAKDSEWRVRWGVTQNDNAPTEVLDALSKDEQWTVRAGVARHGNTSPDVIRTLAGDANEAVVEAAQKLLP